MVGQKANAKAKQVGSRSVILKDGNEFLQARWLKCSKFSDALMIRLFFSSFFVFLSFVYVFACNFLKGGACLPSNRRRHILASDVI